MRARFAVALCGLVYGCQSAPTGGDASADASSDVVVDSAADAQQPPDPDGGTGECNSIENVGSVVRQMFVAGPGATGNGGTIAAGTYVLTAATIYTGPDGGVGPTGTTFVDTLAMGNGGTYQRVFSATNDAGLDGTPFRQSGMIATDGGGLQVTQTCPFGRQPFTSYDSDGTRIRIYAPSGAFGPALMFEYARR